MGLIRVPAMRVPSSRPTVTDSQESFAGGENPKAASNIAPLDQCAAMTNMRLVRDGELAKRPGLLSLGSLSVSSRIYSMMLPAGPKQVAIEIGGGRARTSFTLSWNSTTLSLTTTALSAGSGTYAPGIHAAQFRDASADVLYIPMNYAQSNSGRGMLKWDGATTFTQDVASAQVTNLSNLWVYNQRLFGVTSVDQKLWWSGLNNGDTMGDTANGGGFAVIRTYGGQNILGGFAIGNSNFLLHENAISVFRGTTYDDINITAGTSGVAPNIGLPAAWCVADQVGYVLTTDGLYLVTEGGIRPAGTVAHPDPIRAFLRGGTSANLLADPYNTGPWFVVENVRQREIWCILNAKPFLGSTSSYAFIYNIDLGRFTGRCSFGPVITHALAGWANTGNFPTSPQMFFMASAACYGCDFEKTNFEVYQDNGVSYTSSVRLRRMFSRQAPSDQKAWRSAYVQMGSGAGETAATVGSATGATLGYTNASGTVADTTDLKAQSVNEIQLSGQGPSIDLTITDSGTSSTGWSVQRVDVEGASLGKRGG